MNIQLLEGKTVVVTGASEGIDSTTDEKWEAVMETNVNALTKNMAYCYADGGIRVNALLPGPDGQAYPALFLASDILSHDVTGVCLPVDGGSYML